MKRLLSVAMAVILMFVVLPTSGFAIEQNGNEGKYVGKTVAVLGDSISTYAGVSNNGAANTTIVNSAVCYWPGFNGVYLEDTWWQQAADALGMRLLVNNSWSGSAMFNPRAGTVGAYVDRCVQMHNNITGEEPDVIWIYLGTNDFSEYLGGAISWGTVAETSTELIAENADGTYSYAQPKTYLEAYTIALHKMHCRYPQAEIYCLGMLRRSVISQTLTDSNNELKQLVESLGYTYVDLESCIGPTIEDFRLSNGYDELHPAPEGMDRISRKMISAMLGEETTTADISYQMNNATMLNAARLVLKDGAFSTRLIPHDGYDRVDITVTMGGKDITEICCQKDGTVFIEKVTGDIVIAAEGKQIAHGDADGNGEVDYLDAMLVLQYHTGIVEANALHLAVCDVNGSGEVDYLDAMVILQYHTGVISEIF